jgi:hypothetical protein
MTKQDAIEQLKALQGGGDPECEHLTADDILCQLLESLEFRDVVAEWEKVHKWYA